MSSPKGYILQYYPKVTCILFVLTGVLLIPLLTASIGLDLPYLPFLLGAMIVVLFYSGVLAYFRKGSTLNGLLIIILEGACIATFYYERGELALLWSLPFILTAYLILSVAWATVLSVVFTLSLTLFTMYLFGGESAFRIFAPLLVSTLMATFIASMLGERIINLEKNSSRDLLTGTIHRQFIEDFLELQIHIVQRFKEPSSVALIDIERFERINDIYGYDKGDQVLKEVSARLNEALEPLQKLFRFAGEEFLILLPGIGVDAAKVAMQSVQSEVEKDLYIDKVSIKTTFGITEIKPDDDVEHLIQRLDYALYEEKSHHTPSN